MRNPNLANPTQVRLFREVECHPNHVIEAVLHGDETMVKNILNVSPHYLLKTGTATDFSGRTFTTTPFQAALCAGDVEMCQIMKNYFDRLPNGQAEMQKQCQEIFPNGIKANEKEQKQNAFNFDSIIHAIKRAIPAELDSALNKEGAQLTQTDTTRAKPDDQLTLTEALNRFREQFTKLSHREKIFNPYHLLHALEVRNALWDQYVRDGSDYGNKKRNLFWRQIIGFIQRFMPACYAQAFAQGLYNLVKMGGDSNQWDFWQKPETLNRSLELCNDHFSYFPLPGNSRSGLGFDFAVVVYNAHREEYYCHCTWRRNHNDSHEFSSFFLKNFVQQKQQVFRTLCHEGEYTQHSFSMM